MRIMISEKTSRIRRRTCHSSQGCDAQEVWKDFAQVSCVDVPISDEAELKTACMMHAWHLEEYCSRRWFSYYSVVLKPTAFSSKGQGPLATRLKRFRAQRTRVEKTRIGGRMERSAPPLALAQLATPTHRSRCRLGTRDLSARTRSSPDHSRTTLIEFAALRMAW